MRRLGGLRTATTAVTTSPTGAGAGAGTLSRGRRRGRRAPPPPHQLCCRRQRLDARRLPAPDGHARGHARPHQRRGGGPPQERRPLGHSRRGVQAERVVQAARRGGVQQLGGGVRDAHQRLGGRVVPERRDAAAGGDHPHPHPTAGGGGDGRGAAAIAGTMGRRPWGRATSGAATAAATPAATAGAATAAAAAAVTAAAAVAATGIVPPPPATRGRGGTLMNVHQVGHPRRHALPPPEASGRCVGAGINADRRARGEGGEEEDGGAGADAAGGLIGGEAAESLGVGSICVH